MGRSVLCTCIYNPVLWIRIGLNADLDPVFASMRIRSQGAKPMRSMRIRIRILVSLCRHYKLGFLYEKYTVCHMYVKKVIKYTKAFLKGLKPGFLCENFGQFFLLLDPNSDPHSQFWSGFSRDKSMRIRIHIMILSVLDALGQPWTNNQGLWAKVVLSQTKGRLPAAKGKCGIRNLSKYE